MAKPVKPHQAITLEIEAGFSLLETLIALAILSLVTLAMFQSTSSLLRITDRAMVAGDRTLESAIARKAFRTSVGSLIPAWDEQTIWKFKGGPDEFSGLSAAVPSALDHLLQPVTVSLAENSPGEISLVVTAEGQSWDVEKFRATRASFTYLGMDRTWYDIWPPREIPKPGFYDDEKYMDMPLLPLAIRLSGAGINSNFAWLATVSGSQSLPYRDDFGQDE
ncbi:MAG: hypothetical protein COA47_16415 [Robiginitomaculum sp.]|nr:MAG: hypothetical protein COA47_16415 [Robiginitomaculum sp.]